MSWSLDLEAQFYCSIPLIWLLLARALSGWRSDGPLADVAGRVMLISATPGLLGAALEAGYGLRTALTTAPVFACGLLLLHSAIGRVSNRLAALSVLAFIGFGLAAVMIDPLRHNIIKGLDPRPEISLFSMIRALLLAPFVARNVPSSAVVSIDIWGISPFPCISAISR